MLPLPTPEEAALIEQAKEFTRTMVMPNAARWERERRYAGEALKAAAELGFLGIQVPKSLGGLGLRFSTKLRVTEEISRGCMAFAFALVNAHNATQRIARDGTPDQIARYLQPMLRGERRGAAALTEPGAGSDFAAIETTARKVEGGWRLNGAKAWTSNADMFIAYAQTEPGSRGRGIASFIIDSTQPGFERMPSFQLMGGHAIGTGGFMLKDYFAPDADLFHQPGAAFKNALASINGARTYVAGMCCGMLAEALACAIRYGAERRTFGTRLIDHQGIKWKLAKVANDLEAARLLTYHAASLIDQGGDAMLPAAHAKKFASEMIVERLSDCMQAMGAAGLREEYPIGRHIALGRIANYIDGSTEIQNERIGAALLERYAT